jgi:hypothetical protein
MHSSDERSVGTHMSCEIHRPTGQRVRQKSAVHGIHVQLQPHFVSDMEMATDAQKPFALYIVKEVEIWDIESDRVSRDRTFATSYQVII